MPPFPLRDGKPGVATEQICYLWRQRDRKGKKTMERFIFGVLLVVALSLSGTGADPQCPYDWLSYNGHCYKFFKILRSWHEAEVICSQQGAGSHLAFIQSWAESHYVAKVISRNAFLINVWIGLNDPWKTGTWRWSDGSRC